MLRIRRYSAFAKKCRRSRRIGPPSEKPAAFRSKLAWSRSLAFSSNVRVARSWLRKKSYALPWNAFVPDRVATFTMPPLARPNWAEKLEVMTENS